MKGIVTLLVSFSLLIPSHPPPGAPRAPRGGGLGVGGGGGGGAGGGGAAPPAPARRGYPLPRPRPVPPRPARPGGRRRARDAAGARARVKHSRSRGTAARAHRIQTGEALGARLERGDQAFRRGGPRYRVPLAVGGGRRDRAGPARRVPDRGRRSDAAGGLP